jgi:RNA recognition motif-containing protein
MEPGTNKSKGYAFVKMNRSEDAQKAIAALNGSVVDNRTLKVSEAEERAEFKQSNKSLDKKSTTPKSKKAKEEKEDDVIESVRKKKKKYSGLDELKKYLKKK